MPFRFVPAFIAGCMGLAAALPAPAANLIENANFDSGTAGWQLVPGSGVPSFVIDATQGLPSAPSAHLSSGDPAMVVSACIPVTPQYFDLIASARNQGDQVSSASVTVRFFGDTGCVTPIGSEVLTWTTVETAWMQKASYNFLAPAETIRAQVALSVDGLVTLDGHFDSVFFGPTGTSPVTLQAFDVD